MDTPFGRSAERQIARRLGARTLSQPRVESVVKQPRDYARRLFPVLAIACAFGTAMVMVQGRLEHGITLAIICAGALLNIRQWCSSPISSLPLVAILTLQDLLWYGTPLVANHESLEEYSPDAVVQAGMSMGIYFVCLAIARAFATSSVPAIPRYERLLDVSDQWQARKIVRLLLLGLTICILVEWSFVLGWAWQVISQLPNGSMNVVRTVLAAAEIGAAFQLSFMASKRLMPNSLRTLFWFAVTLIFAAKVASILLSTCVALAGAILLGSYIGRGRIPWTFFLTFGLIISFLNIGKFEMRERYWGKDSDSLEITEVPEYFVKWGGVSLKLLLKDTVIDVDTMRGIEVNDKEDGQSIFERLSNIQMLLYVNDRLENFDDPLLMGETYAVVPKAMVPRFLWRDKPRSHIGQEILSVHFRRQTREETYRTYIAWGLVPESVGNFGPYFGPLLLGLVLGFAFGRIEAYTARCSLFSLPSILAVFLTVCLAGISGVVASVWMATLTQLTFVIVLGLWPFMRVKQNRPGVHHA